MQSTFYLNLPGSLVPGDLSLHVKCIRDWDCQQGTTGGQAPVLVRAVLSKDYNIVEYEEYDLSSLDVFDVKDLCHAQPNFIWLLLAWLVWATTFRICELLNGRNH